MSSIYKKGRDGYYYYQTYVYNPDSKKKDKRIFHALGTRDFEKAKKKQNELDLEYEQKSNSHTKSSKKIFHEGFKQVLAIVFGIIITAAFLTNYFKPDSTNSNKEILANIDPRNTIKDNLVIISDSSGIIEPPSKEKVASGNKNMHKESNASSKIKSDKANIIIPEYTIERIEKLSGAFKQGKLYVTVDENSSKESQKLLCEKLTKIHNQFSNIVICIYTRNRSGINLAKGINESISVEEQKNSWLAMYTYNSVEGEYFDDNPSGYLGNY